MRNEHPEIRTWLNEDNTTARRQIFNQFVALAFLAHEHVPAGYAAILASPSYLANAELLQPFARYFLATWIGLPPANRGGRRGQPQIRTRWNVQRATATQSIRSTSAIEGWHMQFARRLNSVHPSVGRLIAALREQQGLTDRAMLAENATNDVLYARQPRTIPDALVKRVRRGYQQEQILEYLFAISVLITRAQRVSN